MEAQEKEGIEKDLFEHYRFVVDPKQTPIRIDKFLLDRIEKISRNKIQNAIKAGSVVVNEKQVKPNYKVRPNEVISILLSKPPKEGETVLPENIPLEIVYEDNDILIVNKAPGMVVHPGIGNTSGTLVNALSYYLQNTELPVLDGNLADRPGLVHRIDKDTSGLLVIGKNEIALNHLAKQFYDHSIQRSYVALVWGDVEPEEGSIEGHIGRDLSNRTIQRVFEDGEEGKWALTHYKVLENFYYVSLIECQLETGRTHQIRVHMKWKGHPLFNDAKYGGDKIVKGTVFSKYKAFVQNCFDLFPRQALHAKSLGFIHPTTGEKMFFDSPLPENFDALVDKWRRYVSARKDKL
ncbi:MAG: RluA family pseudouridine synthase [Bacteroidota bacterium]